MGLFKKIKQNDVKETRSEIHQKITSNDLKEQHRKAINKYRRYLKEYDEEQTPEKYKELIAVHTELKEIEAKIKNLNTTSNELTNDDFNVKSEDINQSETKEAEIIDTIKQEEEMITGDDGISRPKSMHDQIESNKCLFCEEKFGFTQDWNVHMMNEHQEELVEYNRKEIEKLASTNKTAKKITDMVNIAEVIFEENKKLEHENQQNTEIEKPKEKYDMKKEDPDLYTIQEIIKEKNIQSKEEYDKIMNDAEKDSPYAIHFPPETQPTNKPQIEPVQEYREIVEQLEKISKPVIPTEAIIDLNEIIPKKKQKIKFNLSGIFKHKKFSKLRGIEAYCNICKHTVQQHEYQGKSEGCVKCGCLKTVQEILEVNEINLKYEEKKEIVDNGLICICGHSQLTHKEQLKFCEVEECHCIRFRDK